MEETIVARVAVAVSAYAIDKLYDYLVPQSLAGQIQVGMRVTVPFSRSNRASEGIVLALIEGSRQPRLKAISSALDKESVLSPGQIKLALWLRERYFCTLYDAVKAILPAGLWYRVREQYTLMVDREAALNAGEDRREELLLATLVAHGGSAERELLQEACGDGLGPVLRKLEGRGLLQVQTTASRKISDKFVRRVSLAVDPEEALAAVEPKKRSAPLRYEVIKLLCTIGDALSTDICYFTGCSPQTIRSLEKSGLVTLAQEEVYRVPKAESASGDLICLNAEQQSAYDGILAQTKRGEASCALLYGVTGSGKTAVYIRLLQEIVGRGLQGMILVPEIALTPQMMTKFSAYFGSRVVMLHSSLQLSERYDQWKRIRSGQVDVVLGTRSAVFAPLDRLGMIILDEEQEDSYQSENTPRYHARDVAKYLCAQHRATLVLGSATPSVETTFQAQQGSYKKYILRSRYNQQALPQVLIADLRQEVRNGNAGTVSQVLFREIEKNLSRDEQTILFLNRRGNSRMLLCGECGQVPQCPRCSVPLTYHSANGRLMCHYCGHSEPAQETCSSCGGLMKHVGIGTQKVEEELQVLFPGTEIMRMDADTVSSNYDHLLRKFERDKIPILLGTQMVAKGLDFENVTLVGVLAADLSLYIDHYRAAERTFSLLTQVVGRAGRGSKDGRAVIQTFTPDNDVIVSAAKQDYSAFYQSEIRSRRARCYPPFADIFTITISGPEEMAVLRAAISLRDAMRYAIREQSNFSSEIELLGPAPAPVLKVNNRYRYRLLWIGKNDHRSREFLAYYVQNFSKNKENRKVSLFIDCNSSE